MTRATIEFHARTIQQQTAEMEAAEAAGDKMTAAMIWDAIKFRKAVLAKQGVVIV